MKMILLAQETKCHKNIHEMKNKSFAERILKTSKITLIGLIK